MDVPTCNSDVHKKCIKQKSKVIIVLTSYYIIIFINLFDLFVLKT